MKTGQAKRGQAFEKLLAVTNEQYDKAGIALVHKRIADKNIAVNYEGIYRGKPIYFDVATSKDHMRFQLNDIKDQIFYLEKVEKLGGICFLLIEFSSTREVFFVPLSTMRHYLLHARNGGRKSIPKDDFDYYAYEVRKSKRALLDYLIHVDRLIGDGAA